jgi:hypothetical protein
MWRLTRPLGSPNARGVGLLLYAVVPLPWDCVARGSWAGLILYGAAPWLLAALAEAAGELPGDEPPRARPFLHRALGLGLLLAVVAAFVPLALPLLVVVAVAILLGGLLAGDHSRPFGPLALAGAAAGIAAVLHLPWLIALVTGDRWSLAGVAAGGTGSVSVSDLLRFQTGPVGVAWVGWSIPVAAALALLMGRAWRFRWAVRCWSVAIACWTLAVVGGHLDLGLPPAEVLLAPGAAALALAGALGVSSFELDLRGFRFGWRQVASLVAAAGVVLTTLPIAFGALDGSWELRGADHARSLAPLGIGGQVGSVRVLWIGAPEVLPVAGFHLAADLSYAVTTDSTGGVLDRWATSGDGAVALVAQSIDAASTGRTERLGALLAPFGIRYVVLVDRAAPERTASALRAVPPTYVEMAARQLDLRRIEIEPAIRVFENVAPAAVRTAFASPSDATVAALASTAPLPAALALGAGAGALRADRGTDRAAGQVPAGSLLLGSPADGGWRLSVDGKVQARRQALGWANAWTVPTAGRATLTYETSPRRLVVVAVQAIAWLAALVVVLRRWRRHA